MRIKGWQELNLPSRKSSVLSKARKFSVQIPLAWLLTIIWEIFSASHLTFQAWQTSDSESLSTLNVYCYNSTVTREWERSTTAVLLFLGFYGLPCFFTQDGNDNDLDFFVLNHFRTVVRFTKSLLGGVSVSIMDRTPKMSNSEFFMIAWQLKISKANSLFHKNILSNNSNLKENEKILLPSLRFKPRTSQYGHIFNVLEIANFS